MQLTTASTVRRRPEASTTTRPSRVSSAASTSSEPTRREPSARSRATAAAVPGGIRCRWRSHQAASVLRKSARSSGPRQDHRAAVSGRRVSKAGRQSRVSRTAAVTVSRTRVRSSSRSAGAVPAATAASGALGAGVGGLALVECAAGTRPRRDTACRVRPGRARVSATSTMVRPVPTSSTSPSIAASWSSRSSAPGAHGSATNRSEVASASGAQAVPGAKMPGASTIASAVRTLPSARARCTPPGTGRACRTR